MKNLQKTINRDIIKYIAIVLMAVDHSIQCLPLVEGYTYQLLDGLSHFTYVTMAFFLIESYKYTHSKKDYLIKMLIFAAISQVPYTLAFSGNMSFCGLNIFFTLVFNFILIWLLDITKNPLLKIVYGIIAIIVGCFCDWIIMAPIITMLFWWARDNKKRQWIAYVGVFVLVELVANGSLLFTGGLTEILSAVFASGWGVVLSCIFTLWLYNGKKMEGFNAFNKWFFYIFYPAHLLIIALIKLV